MIMLLQLLQSTHLSLPSNSDASTSTVLPMVFTASSNIAHDFRTCGGKGKVMMMVMVMAVRDQVSVVL